MTNCTA